MVSYSPRLKDRSMYGVEMSAFKWPCVVCRQVDVSPNSWRETWWCSSTVETFPNTHTTRLSCSYEPAESRTPESWPCWSDVKVCVCVIQTCTLTVMFIWIFITALNRPCPGPGRVAPLLQLPPALTLTSQSQGDKPQSSGQSERVTTLEESMRHLERGIQSGTLCFHFEVFLKCRWELNSEWGI